MIPAGSLRLKDHFALPASVLPFDNPVAPEVFVPVLLRREILSANSAFEVMYDCVFRHMLHQPSLRPTNKYYI